MNNKNINDLKQTESIVREKKKYFVTSDIHGYYTQWMNALEKNGFEINNSNHILIICGDIIDRGKEVKKIIDFLYSFPSNRLIMIRGNHEDLFEQMIFRGYPLSHDYHNGTVSTYMDLFNEEIDNGYDEYKHSKLAQLINQMIDYYETEKYIFVHGWIPSIPGTKYGEYTYDPNWRKADIEAWNMARWTNGMKANLQGDFENKIIVCGHYHASYGNVRKRFPNKSEVFYSQLEFSDNEYFEPYYNKGIICIDACTAYTKLVNVLVLDEEDL